MLHRCTRILAALASTTAARHTLRLLSLASPRLVPVPTAAASAAALVTRTFSTQSPVLSTMAKKDKKEDPEAVSEVEAAEVR